jgi:ATP-dependent DNA helicase PIF1
MTLFYIQSSTMPPVKKKKRCLSSTTPAAKRQRNGTPTVCTSADTTVNEDEATRFPTEYLNSLNVAGLPPHRLSFKEGMPLILLRNLNPKEGLCNGTRLIVKKLTNGRLLEAVIANGDHAGRMVLIPRITLQPSDDAFPFEWKRRQFPVRVAFAMTINKSQGQSLARVAVWLEEPVFSHGQLYVAASRVGHPDNIRFAIMPKPGLPARATCNVVYKEVLSSPTK